LAYRLKRKETVPDGVRRVAKQQLARAAGELGDERLEPADQIHQVRKRLKKLRALLRLVRDDIGKSAYQAENDRLRTLGRRLSAARDAQVMLDTAVALAGDHPELATSGFDALRSYLQSQLEREAVDDRSAGHLIDEVSGELAAADARVDDWPLDTNGFSGLAPGLRRAYKKGRKALKHLDNDSTDDHLHAWRKRVKDQWYHGRLLESVWPEVMSCRVDELKKLSELLGDYHDLAVFQATLGQLPEDILCDGSDAQWNRCVAQEKDMLRRNAEQLGARVYAEPPKAFEHRLKRYWQTWRLGD
jgi:CHAD domain-containing protein